MIVYRLEVNLFTAAYVIVSSAGLAPQSPLMSEWEETERVLKAGRKMLRETDNVVMDAMTSDVCVPARSRNLSELVNQGLQQIQHWIASM